MILVLAAAYITYVFCYGLILSAADVLFWISCIGFGSAVGWIVGEVVITDTPKKYVAVGAAIGCALAHVFSLLPRIQ
jgi:hypothetical protein